MNTRRFATAMLGQRRPVTTPALALVIGLVLGGIATQPVQAQRNIRVLYTFTGGADGGNPTGRLVGDGAGNLYGTTSFGGAFGGGTVFKLDSTGNETVLYSFGVFANPYAGVVRDAAGNLYGTTPNGGTFGYGTVFQVNSTGQETVLHSFSGDPDGKYPNGGLVRDAAGNLYGTTTYGGTYFGTVFKVDSTGHETVLYSFSFADGAYPSAELVRDAPGNLYGTTELGGNFGKGTVFKVDSTGHETVLYSFTDDGAGPAGGLVRDAAGNLYGTTYGGGTSGYGSVFKLDSTGTETVLYRFMGGSDGAYPLAGLVRDAAGSLYGTTQQGDGIFSYGTVFKVDSTGHETVLHRFTGGADGASPFAGLFRDAGTPLYGTTSSGGTSGSGVVFELK